MNYAENTSVSIDRTRLELEKLLRSVGATQFVSGWDAQRAAVEFVFRDRRIRHTLSVPPPDSRQFTRTDTGRPRAKAAAAKAWEQEKRSQWRTLLLTIKAKLAAIHRGISTVEEEFLAWTVLPGTNMTVYESIGERLTDAIDTGKPPVLLLGSPSNPDHG